uniref:Phosphoglycerate mutase family protein n=1 Tax=Steinernema glaseri TaxID=37863 RepID=A0A1I7ZIZ0_9BILA
MGRILWVVRHAEREDNINRRWRENSDLRPDNSPLSKRGCVQAQELAKRFENVQLDHVFASPFDRTVDTASRLVGHRDIAINVEPGLCEALYLCERPPGFEPIEKIKAKYPLVDINYQPIVGPKMPKEGYGDDACVPRLRTTLNGILGACKTGSVLLMAHGASVGAIHEVLIGDFKYVGQATVTKFVEKSQGKFQLEFSGDSSHLSDRSNLRPW